MRIWWQSFVDEETAGAYLENLREYFQRITSSNVSVEVVGLTPPARGWSRLSEMRGAISSVKAALQAEEEGFDAFVIGHFQEPGLYEIRSTVNIPVIGLGESVLLWSSHLGRRIGLISVDSSFETIHLEQMDRLGLGPRLVGIRDLHASLEEFENSFTTEGYAALRSRFIQLGSELVALGADVLVPAGGLFGMSSAHEMDFEIDGVPVVPTLQIALEWAQMTVRINRTTGVRPSRKSSFIPTPESAINDFLGLLR
jgi:Asp/Glu/hydantoin racemase